MSSRKVNRRPSVENRLPEQVMPNEENLSVDVILSILGQRKRIDLLRILVRSDAGMGVTSMSKELQVSAPTVEKHLSILKKLGLVKKQVTLEFTRERWVIRGRTRVSKLLKTLDSDVQTLVNVGRLMEELENTVRRQQYYKEHGSSAEQKQDSDNKRFDYLLEKLGKEMVSLLDEEEQKKVSYWSSTRSMGLL